MYGDRPSCRSKGCVLTSVCVGTYLGAMSHPCCMREPIVNQNELFRENLFSNTSGSSELQGCGFSHSYGLNLNTKRAHLTTEAITDDLLSMRFVCG